MNSKKHKLFDRAMKITKRFQLALLFLFSVSKVTYSQQIDFSQTYFFGNNMLANDFILTSDSLAFITVGYAYAPSGGNSYILKCDRNGDTLWYRTSSLFNNSMGADNKAYFVKEIKTGLYLSGGVAGFAGYLSMYDSTGNLLWEKFYEIQSLRPLLFNSAIGIGESIYVFGRLSNPSESVFLKINLLGDTVFSKISEFINVISSDQVLKKSDHTMVLYSFYTDSISGYRFPYISQLDTLGNIIDLHTFPDSASITPLQLRRNRNSELLFVAKYSQGNFKLFKTDSLGNLIWSKLISFDSNPCFLNFTNTDDIVMTGNIASSSDYNIWIVLNESGSELYRDSIMILGAVTGTITLPNKLVFLGALILAYRVQTISQVSGVLMFSSQEEAKDILFNIYPNPVSQNENIHIEYRPKMTFQGDSKIRIINTSGIILREYILSGHAKKFIVPMKLDLAKGLYLIVVEEENQILSKKIIIN